jgi:hypothetical protein
MVRHIARRHARVLVVIGVNASKTYAVSGDARAELLRDALRALGLDHKARDARGRRWSGDEERALATGRACRLSFRSRLPYRAVQGVSP